MKNLIDERSSQLLGDKFERFTNAKVLVIGLGGVGSSVVNSLVRSGIKNITLLDFDKVSESNLNRQIPYDSTDIGKYKTKALIDKMLLIRNDINLKSLNLKIEENINIDFIKEFDFIFDCIDDVKAKVYLISKMILFNLNHISCLGTGNRIKPEKLIITTINNTKDDPLARKIRYLLRKNNVELNKNIVIYSEEKPVVYDKIVSSMIFVPNTAGLMMCSYFIQKYLNI